MDPTVFALGSWDFNFSHGVVVDVGFDLFSTGCLRDFSLFLYVFSHFVSEKKNKNNNLRSPWRSCGLGALLVSAVLGLDSGLVYVPLYGPVFCCSHWTWNKIHFQAYNFFQTLRSGYMNRSQLLDYGKRK